MISTIISVLGIVINTIWAIVNLKTQKKLSFRGNQPHFEAEVILPPDDMIGDSPTRYIIRNNGKGDAYNLKISSFYQDDDHYGRVNGVISPKMENITVRMDKSIEFDVYWTPDNSIHSVPSEEKMFEDSISIRTARKKEYFQLQFHDKYNNDCYQTLHISYVNYKQRSVIVTSYDTSTMQY